jgi:hypothetical protein
MSHASRTALALATLAATGCGKQPGVLAIDVGRETASLSAAPAPSHWEIGFTDTANTRTVVGQGDWPSSGLDADLDPDLVGSFDVIFSDASGAGLVVGESPSIVVSDLPGRRLTIFAQRRGAFARPTPDLDGRLVPAATVVGGRLIVVGGGNESLGAFDLALVQTLANQSLSLAPEALASTDAAVFGGAAGRLVRLDLDTGDVTDVVVPSTIAPAELAQAPMVARAGGFAWVGPARGTDASSAVLFLDADETVHTARLPTAAKNCAVTALSDGALLVACESGAWHVAVDATLSTPFPALGVVQAIAPFDDGTLAAAAGGHAYRLPAGCDSACVPSDLGELACASRVQMAALGTEVLVACDDADGATRAFRLQRGAPAAIELREPRRGATLVSVSAREAALVGGGPASFERYRAL